MSAHTSLQPNRESPSWEKMTPAARRLVAAAAGYKNIYQLARIAVSEWAELFEPERTALYRVNWRAVIARQERKRSLNKLSGLDSRS